jgi:hypothetical protein
MQADQKIKDGKIAEAVQLLEGILREDAPSGAPTTIWAGSMNSNTNSTNKPKHTTAWHSNMHPNIWRLTTTTPADDTKGRSKP